jgi:MFS family permease
MSAQPDRAGPGPYRQILATQGAWRFVAAGFVSRLTTAMLGLSLILAITQRGGGYGLAGLAGAAVVLASGVCGPITGRYVDRYGQAAVLTVVAVAFGVTMAATVLALHAGAPGAVLVGLALLDGATMPVTSPFVRARWTRVLADSPLLRTAYAFEGATTELVYIVGPILVAFVSTAIGPIPGIVAVLVCALTGTLALAAQRSTEPPPHGQPVSPGGAVMGIRAMQVLFVAVFGLGGVLGSLDIVTVAQTTALHHRGSAGLLLGLFGVGSMLAGLAYGAWQVTMPVQRRLLLVIAASAVALVPLAFATTLVTTVLLLLLAGVALAPALITNMELVQRVVPPTAYTESFFWVLTAMAFGMTAGNLVGGIALDHDLAGNHPYAISTAFGFLAIAAVGLGYGGLRAAMDTMPAAQDRPADEAAGAVPAER